MEEYNKEKLHEYAKELFALCLENELDFGYDKIFDEFSIRIEDSFIFTKISKDEYTVKDSYFMPIWELIEKVKAL